MQAVDDVCKEMGLYVPAVQFVQEVAAGPDQVPGPQLAQAKIDAPPALGFAVPARQIVHDEDPAGDQLPAPQSAQLDIDVDLIKGL